MFELSKYILGKVSFDKILFQKELVKAAKWLKGDEKILLKVWCLSSFSIYRETIIEVFRNVSKT